MIRSDGISIVPILHGRAAIGAYVRDCCAAEPFECIAVDLPAQASDDIGQALLQLPVIYAVTLSVPHKPDFPWYYIPMDPCDAAIEGLRQAQQNHIPGICIGQWPESPPKPIPPLPDEHAVKTMGFDAYASLCIHEFSQTRSAESDEYPAGLALAGRLRGLKTRFNRILALIHFRHLIPCMHALGQERTYNLAMPAAEAVITDMFPIHPDHLYFALGELPFITGLCEKERHDPFAPQVNIPEAIKDLFCTTRDDYMDSREEVMALSSTRIQNAITFARNLTLLESRCIPSLFDIVTAAKGVGGNSFGRTILKSAKYYPYLPLESADRCLHLGMDKLLPPGGTEPKEAVNLLRDTALLWRTIALKPDPGHYKKKQYKYRWNPAGMCSHVPEDRYIELFNAHVRSGALRILQEGTVKTEKFEASVKDGIDIRETLRNFHTGDIYVKELPPARGNVDTVVIIFDESHDERYPHHTVWFAEHGKESTLTFYASDPFENLIGPGIAQCVYGGLSLLYPPRPIPDIFALPLYLPTRRFSHRLTFGALLNTQERSVAYIAARAPDVYCRKMAAGLRKSLLWIPSTRFSAETLGKLRRFHVLNGKTVRTWANRFIGD